MIDFVACSCMLAIKAFFKLSCWESFCVLESDNNRLLYLLGNIECAIWEQLITFGGSGGIIRRDGASVCLR